MDYKKSGVDIEAGYKSVELMKKFVQGTMRPEVLGGLGGFSGAFSMKSFKDMEEPTLLSGCLLYTSHLSSNNICNKNSCSLISCSKFYIIL